MRSQSETVTVFKFLGSSVDGTSLISGFHLAQKNNRLASEFQP